MKICSACGHALIPDGPCGFASITVGEKTTYLCHADDHSCYSDAEIERLRHEWVLLIDERADLNAEIVRLRERLLIAQRLADTATAALPEAETASSETREIGSPDDQH